MIALVSGDQQLSLLHSYWQVKHFESGVNLKMGHVFLLKTRFRNYHPETP